MENADDYEELQYAARWMDYGEEKTSLLRRAVTLAAAAGETEDEFDLRLELIEALTFQENNRSEEQLVHFTWCIACYDSDPEGYAYQLHTLLWDYKWVLGSLTGDYRFPIAQVRQTLDDYTRRLREAGYTSRAALPYQADLALATGANLESVQPILRDILETPGDDNSDCRACELNGVVRHHLDQGNFARAIELAEPLLERRYTCTHVPLITWGRILLPYLELGMPDSAERYYRRARQHFTSHSDSTSNLEHLLIYLTVAGRTRSLKPLLQRFCRHYHDQQSPRQKMVLAMGVAVALEHLSPAQRGRLALDPGEHHATWRQLGITDADALCTWTSAEAQRLATAFDARNGSDHYTRRLAASMAAPERLRAALKGGSTADDDSD